MALPDRLRNKIQKAIEGGTKDTSAFLVAFGKNIEKFEKDPLKISTGKSSLSIIDDVLKCLNWVIPATWKKQRNSLDRLHKRFKDLLNIKIDVKNNSVTQITDGADIITEVEDEKEMIISEAKLLKMVKKEATDVTTEEIIELE